MDRNRLIADITASRDTSSGPKSSDRGRIPVSRLPAAVLAEVSRLTIRDLTILDLLAEHLTFTTEQLTALAFGSAGRARNRLGVLRERELLDRFRHYIRPGSQSWRWTLGPVGAAVIAAGCGEALPRPAVVRDAAARLAVSPTLGHRLAVNGFFVALLAHTRDHDDVSLTRWWNETRCRDAAGNLVRPDDHGLWVACGRAVPFWVEVDLGTETLRRVAAKLTGYAHLAGTERGYPVLFWLPTPSRETNLHTYLSRVGAPDGLVVATSAPGYGDPAGQVWQVLGTPGRVALADLPLPAGSAATCDG